MVIMMVMMRLVHVIIRSPAVTVYSYLTVSTVQMQITLKTSVDACSGETIDGVTCDQCLM